MKLAKSIAAAAITAAVALPAFADPASPTATFNLTGMPGKFVWGGEAATVTPLQMTDGKPTTVLVQVKPNSPAVKGHKTGDGLVRLAFVVSGTLYYGDGEVVDTSKEKAYRPGDVLVIYPETHHWVATREDGLELVLVAGKEAALSPFVTKAIAQ